MDYSRETPSTEMILRKSPFVFKRRSEAPSAGHFIRRQPPLAVHTDRDPKFIAFLLSLRHQRGCSTTWIMHTTTLPSVGLARLISLGIEWVSSNFAASSSP